MFVSLATLAASFCVARAESSKRLDAEVIEVRRDEFALDEVFEHLERMFEPAASERGLDYTVRFPALAVRSDRVLLERILANLVSNAIRYTDRGAVTLSAERHGEEVLVTVADSGPGIPERERDAVFDEYYQIDPPEGVTSGGLGLGLSIVHRLARLLELPLEIDSTIGAGTRFALRVPLGDEAALARAPCAPAPVRFDGVHFDGLVVLVVDDDRDVRDGMHRLLEQRSCHVMAVESAAEARAARLRQASASGFRLLHEPVVPEEMFDAIGELAGRIDR